MKVLVCGDRNWTDRECIRAWLCKLQDEGYNTVVEGEARGADKLAREEALRMGMTVLPYHALWARYGRAAGNIRNRRQYDIEQPDLVLAFHSNITTSKGTKDMVNYAKSKGATVIVVKE